jgi:hypothetical protein
VSEAVRISSNALEDQCRVHMQNCEENAKAHRSDLGHYDWNGVVVPNCSTLISQKRAAEEAAVLHF